MVPLCEFFLNSLSIDGVLECFNVRAEVLGEEIPAVAGLKTGIGDDVEGLDPVAQELQSHRRSKSRRFWDHEVALGHADQTEVRAVCIESCVRMVTQALPDDLPDNTLSVVDLGPSCGELVRSPLK